MFYKLHGCVFGRAGEREGHFISVRVSIAPLCQRAMCYAHSSWPFRETFEEPGRHSGQSVAVKMPAASHCGQRVGAKKRLHMYVYWRYLAMV